jgi:hypothetical protein
MQIYSDDDASSTSIRPISNERKKYLRRFLNRVRHLTRGVALWRPLTQSRLSQPMLLVSSRLGRECSFVDDEVALCRPSLDLQYQRRLEISAM